MKTHFLAVEETRTCRITKQRGERSDSAIRSQSKWAQQQNTRPR
jgi:hypothetical protein